MSVELLIAFYIFVCVGMALFNLGFLAYEKIAGRRSEKKAKQIAEAFDEEIKRNVDFPTPLHIKVLERRMHRLSGMEAFDRVMDHLEESHPDSAQRYLRGVAVVFEHLTYYFANKKSLNRAYFCYIVKRWYRVRPASETVLESLLRLVRVGSFYERQNALEALAELGNAQALAKAIILIESDDVFHSPRLITEAAMAFSGDALELSLELKRHFGEMKPEGQVSVLNFLRMTGVGDEPAILGLMTAPDTDKEVRLACMRYFSRHVNVQAKGIFLQMLANEKPAQWEYAAVAATALCGYEDEDVVPALKRALTSKTWYVRHNAAKSLYDKGLSLEDMRDVLDGDDRFAADMVRYRWSFEDAAAGGNLDAVNAGSKEGCVDAQGQDGLAVAGLPYDPAASSLPTAKGGAQ